MPSRRVDEGLGYVYWRLAVRAPDVLWLLEAFTRNRNWRLGVVSLLPGRVHVHRVAGWT